MCNPIPQNLTKNAASAPQSAVELEALAGGVRQPVVKRPDEPSHRHRGVERPQRVLGEDLRPPFGSDPRGHPGLEKPREDDVDPDSVATMPGGQVAGEAQQGRFGRGIRRQPRWRLDRGKARNKQQMPPATVEHSGQRRCRACRGTLEIDLHDLVPPRFIQPNKRGLARYSGGTHQQVDHPASEKFPDTGGLGDVEFLPSGCGNPPLRVGESRRDRARQAAVTTGDDQLVQPLWGGIGNWRGGLLLVLVIGHAIE